MDQVYARIETIFRDVFDDDTITVRPELTADDVPEWDSLSHIRLILAVQREFKTKFSAAEVGALQNVGSLAALIRSKTVDA